MARIKYASIVSSVSGSVGSATFQKSLYGDILRSKPIPRSSDSSLQTSQRLLMLQIHQAWSALNDAQRKAWNRFISYSSASIRRDRSILQTGHSLFIQYNMLRLLTGYAIMSDVAFLPLTGILDSYVLSLGAGPVLNLNVEDEFPHIKTFFVVKLSAPRKPALSFSPVGLRRINIPGESETNWNIQSQYMALFGTLPSIGDSVHYSIRRFSTVSPICESPRVGIFIVANHDI